MCNFQTSVNLFEQSVKHGRPTGEIIECNGCKALLIDGDIVAIDGDIKNLNLRHISDAYVKNLPVTTIVHWKEYVPDYKIINIVQHGNEMRVVSFPVRIGKYEIYFIPDVSGVLNAMISLTTKDVVITQAVYGGVSIPMFCSKHVPQELIEKFGGKIKRAFTYARSVFDPLPESENSEE